VRREIDRQLRREGPIMSMTTRVASSAAALAVCAGAAIYVFVLRDGLAANRPPGRIETVVARRIVRLSIPAAHRSALNPYADNGEAWRDGSRRFAAECASCHGSDGRGALIGRAMYPPVPDLRSQDIRELSDGALFAVIRNGIRWTGMPAFADHQTSDDTWKLVSYVRHLPAARSAKAN
jgi:mono/diheme cytochrome c family protein